MSKNPFILLIILLLVTASDGCKNNKAPKRIPVAEVGNTILYYDMIPGLIQKGTKKTDSIALVQNYINKWAKRMLLLQKAEENLSASLKNEVNEQLEETRSNLLIYQYERQMIMQKLDTVLAEAELENYYASNEKAFILTSNIVKALFIKIPSETPDLNRIRTLARSNDQKDLQNLESICYQFADKFDDFNEGWVPMDKISVELPHVIGNQEDFLRRNTFFETSDSFYVYLVSVRDYRLRSTLAPFEYVRNDIKRTIWNSRRIALIQNLENGIYNDALKENNFKIY